MPTTSKRKSAREKVRLGMKLWEISSMAIIKMRIETTRMVAFLGGDFILGTIARTARKLSPPMRIRWPALSKWGEISNATDPRHALS